MKKLIIPFVALFVVTVALVSWRSHSKAEGADVVTEFGCGIVTPFGFYFTTDSHSVVTPSGNTSLSCHFEGINNTSGKAWTEKGALCGTFLGLTNDTRKTVTPSGNGSLTCNINGN